MQVGLYLFHKEKTKNTKTNIITDVYSPQKALNAKI